VVDSVQRNVLNIVQFVELSRTLFGDMIYLEMRTLKKFDDLSLIEYVILELVIGLIDLGIFILIIKSGII
jgi:hypothetical protein